MTGWVGSAVRSRVAHFGPGTAGMPSKSCSSQARCSGILSARAAGVTPPAGRSGTNYEELANGATRIRAEPLSSASAFGRLVVLVVVMVVMSLASGATPRIGRHALARVGHRCLGGRHVEYNVAGVGVSGSGGVRRTREKQLRAT